MDHLEVEVSTAILLLAGVGILLSVAFVDQFGLSIWVASLLLVLLGVTIKMFNK